MILGSPPPGWSKIGSSLGPETDPKDPEKENGSLATEKRVDRIPVTLETAFQIMLCSCSLVAPRRGAGGCRLGHVVGNVVGKCHCLCVRGAIFCAEHVVVCHILGPIVVRCAMEYADKKERLRLISVTTKQFGKS